MGEDVPACILASGKWIINGQWVVDEKVATGGFGSVYKGHDIHTHQLVAVKIEKEKNKRNYVEKECQIYKILDSIPGFPNLYWMGKTTFPSEGGDKPCVAMIMDFLGPSLSDWFYKQQKGFSLKTVLLLADQMIERLEILHDRGVVHRDIKPGNFVMGIGPNDRCVYLIDFGLSHNYCIQGKHIGFVNNVPFRGTHRYASVNAHEKVEQTRRDDLESLAYVLIYFLRGELPWQNLNIDKNNRRQVIGEIKKNIPISQITAGVPEEFTTFLNVVRKLEFHEKPPYSQLRALLQKCFYDRKYHPDGIYDWTMNSKAIPQPIPLSLPNPTPILPPILKYNIPTPNMLKYKLPKISTDFDNAPKVSRKRKSTDKPESEPGKKPRNVQLYPSTPYPPTPRLNSITQTDISNITNITNITNIRPISFSHFNNYKQH